MCRFLSRLLYPVMAKEAADEGGRSCRNRNTNRRRVVVGLGFLLFFLTYIYIYIKVGKKNYVKELIYFFPLLSFQICLKKCIIYILT